MSAPAIVFYITGHGLGHATRMIAVMRALLEAAGEARPSPGRVRVEG